MLNIKIKGGKLWTYTYPNNSKAHQYYIFINMKWTVRYTPLLKEYLLITESSQQRFARIYAEIRHKKLKVHNMTGPYSRIVWYSSGNIWKTCQNNEYENFVTAHIETAAECIPTLTKSQMLSSIGGNWRKMRWHEKVSLLNERNPILPMRRNSNPKRTNTYQKEWEYIQGQINKIRNLVEDRQSWLVW